MANPSPLQNQWSAPEPEARSAGVLLIYHRFRHLGYRDAETVTEHIEAFARHSRFPLWSVNAADGYRPELEKLHFDAVVFHYSLFGMGAYQLGPGWERWEEWIASTNARRVAFFQDEHFNVQRRHDFIERNRVDLVFTCVTPMDFEATYGQAARSPALVSNLPGYVSDRMVEQARKYEVKRADRPIDVGYRGRPLAPYMGKGSLEKTAIAEEFVRKAAGSGLRLDIDTSEEGRLYGPAWTKFVCSCKAMLGVESGVSVFDLDGVVYAEYLRRLEENPQLKLEDLADVLAPYEDKIHYRTISPRHFEAAASRVLQVLFEGDYSGVMEPMRHYIPLKKDFSNIDFVLAAMHDEELAGEICENAYRDLIVSGDYSYSRLITEFDQSLLNLGLTPELSVRRNKTTAKALRRGWLRRTSSPYLKHLRHLLYWSYVRTYDAMPSSLLRPLRRLKSWLTRQPSLPKT